MGRAVRQSGREGRHAMILLAFLAAQAVQLPAPAQPKSEDVVVIAQKLKSWRGKVGDASRTPIRCRTVKSTGDREVDGIGCRTMVECFSRMRERIVALGDRHLPKAARGTQRAAVERDIGACVDERHDVLVAELAELRFQARQRNAH